MTMPPDAEARLEASISRVADALRDDFDVEDIAILVREAVEIAEAFEDLDGSEKKALALAFLERVVDDFFATATPALEKMVEDLDLPGPAWLERAAFDPIVKAIAPALLRPALKAALPALVDLVVNASRGALDINMEDKR